MRAALLNNLDHQALRLRPLTRHSAVAMPGAVPTVPAEFRLLQAHYPVLFQAAGPSFQPVALLGLEQGQNLFLNDKGWDAAHLPWALERQPLLVGRDGANAVVHIDLDHPLLSECEGEPLFLPHGGQAPLLEQRVAVLQALHQGLEELPAFIEALCRLELLEPLHFDVDQPDGSVRRLSGYHGINEERLAALPGSAVATLHEAGHWLPIAMALASLGRLRDLVEREARQRG